MAGGFFVTGTDTDCGKTEITLGLMHRLQRSGLSVQGFKPVAAGAEATPEGLRNGDALRIQRQCSRELAYAEINPYVYAPPIAPHLAAQAAGICIDVARIREAFSRVAARSDLVIVEGAGGWQVPLNDELRISELAGLLGLPVILVVGMRLGCINHAILTAESICRSGLRFAGWVANHLDPEMQAREGNLRTLQQWLSAPCLGQVPYLERATPQRVGDCLTLSAQSATRVSTKE